jgi:CRP-like cAMP-binding protein
MAHAAELTRFPVFAGSAEEQLDWFLSQAEELTLQPEEIYIHQGDPADWMFVVIDGQLQARGEIAGEVIMVSSKPGDVTGVLPFSRMKQYPLTGKAITSSRVLRFPAARFPDLVQKMPELAGRLVGVMSDRIRETTRIEQQRDRLAGLG